MRRMGRMTIAVLAPYLAVAAVVWGLKAHYSRADARDLEWILAPTATAVRLAGGFDLEREPAAGYLDRDRRFVIAPACAGVNFLIIAFACATLGGLHRFQSQRGRWGWIALCLAAAGGAAVAVNTGRIVLSVYLYQADVGGGWLTTERVHRLVGVGVYLAALGFWHLGMDRLARTLSDRSQAASLVLPLCLYLAVTVAVPLVRLGWHGGANQMHEHLLTVTAAVAVVLGVLGVWRWLVRPLVSNP